MTSLRIEVIRDHGAFLAIRDEWDELVDRARVEHPFLRHDWVCTWWECFGADKELHVLAVRSGDVLVGLAPLMRTRARMYGLPVRRLEFMVNVHTPRFDFIVAERSDEFYAMILDYLRTQAPCWDVVMLPELAENSRTAPALRGLAEATSVRTSVWVAGASPRIVLDGSFDAFCARLSAKRRSSLRKRLRRLELLGPASVEVVSEVDQLAGALRDGMRIEAATWKGDAGTAIVSHEDLTRFYAQIAERAARSKVLSLLFLKVGEKRIAFAYCLRQGRTLYLLKTGYDPEYAAYSPFNALMLLTIEASFRDGVDAFDLLGCEEPWKRVWTSERIERRWLFLYGNTSRARVIYYVKVVLLPWLKRAWLAVASGGQSAAPTEVELAGAQP